jgi:hypothetical protein
MCAYKRLRWTGQWLDVSDTLTLLPNQTDLSRPTTPAAGGHPAVAKSVGDEVRTLTDAQSSPPQ